MKKKKKKKTLALFYYDDEMSYEMILYFKIIHLIINEWNS